MYTKRLLNDPDLQFTFIKKPKSKNTLLFFPNKIHSKWTKCLNTPDA